MGFQNAHLISGYCLHHAQPDQDCGQGIGQAFAWLSQLDLFQGQYQDDGHIHGGREQGPG